MKIYFLFLIWVCSCTSKTQEYAKYYSFLKKIDKEILSNDEIIVLSYNNCNLCLENSLLYCNQNKKSAVVWAEKGRKNFDLLCKRLSISLENVFFDIEMRAYSMQVLDNYPLKITIKNHKIIEIETLDGSILK